MYNDHDHDEYGDLLRIRLALPPRKCTTTPNPFTLVRFDGEGAPISKFSCPVEFSRQYDGGNLAHYGKSTTLSTHNELLSTELNPDLPEEGHRLEHSSDACEPTKKITTTKNKNGALGNHTPHRQTQRKPKHRQTTNGNLVLHRQKSVRLAKRESPHTMNYQSTPTSRFSSTDPASDNKH